MELIDELMRILEADPNLAVHIRVNVSRHSSEPFSMRPYIRVRRLDQPV